MLFRQLLATMIIVAGVSTASATEIDRRKGIGLAHAIGGPVGLSFNYGLGSLGLEAIVGLSRFSYVDDEPEPKTFFGGGVGAHFHLLSSEHAALTLGGRFNLATGTANVGIRDAAGLSQSTETREVTQFGFDIPLRVYWFPTRHISIHTEFGIAILMGAEDAVLFSARDGDGALAPEGLAIIAFRHATPLGQLGLTYWW